MNMFCSQGVTVSTMKSIFEELMALFPDQFFHLGLDEVETSAVCSLESKTFCHLFSVFSLASVHEEIHVVIHKQLFSSN